jgi:LCP family protein required for cell wall assembly
VTETEAAARVRTPRRRFARALSWVALLTSVAVLASAGVGYAVLRHFDDNIRRLPDVVDAKPRGTSPGTKAQNILMVGSDSREGLTGEEAFQGKGSGFITGQRSDTIILAHLFGSSRKAQLVSLPRDTYVQIPAYTDPKTKRRRGARADRLNAAFALGGPALLVATVQKLTGVRIDHYVQVDFRGFKALVDTVDGVEVCLLRPQRDFRSGIDLQAGRQTVRGSQALAFVRQRAGLARGDIDRIGRQQLMMGALVRKVLSTGTLLNPGKLTGVLGVATRSLQVDSGLSFNGLRDLALRLRKLEPGSVIFTTAPVADLNADRGGKSVVLLKTRESKILFDRLRRDIPPPPRTGAPPPDQRTAAQDACV